MSIEDGLSISGTGSVLGDSPILQDKGYFEMTIQKEGTWAVGVCTKETDLKGTLSQEKVKTAWTLVSSMAGLPALPAGSTLGIALDQGDYPVQVYFYLDGKVVHDGRRQQTTATSARWITGVTYPLTEALREEDLLASQSAVVRVHGLKSLRSLCCCWVRRLRRSTGAPGRRSAGTRGRRPRPWVIEPSPERRWCICRTPR